MNDAKKPETMTHQVRHGGTVVVQPGEVHDEYAPKADSTKPPERPVGTPEQQEE